MSSALDSSFWRRFVEESWQKKPLFVPQAFPSGPPVDGDELHAACTAAADAWLKGRPCVPPQAWSSSGRLTRQAAAVLPCGEDPGLAGWFSKVSAAHADVMVYALEAQAHSWPIFEAALQLAEGLQGSLEGVVGQVDADVFLGNYERLPFGIHYDLPANFTIGVEGVRQLRLWSPEAFDSEVPVDVYRTDPESYDAGSTLYEVEPGDLLYWPARWGHVGYCPDGPSATMSVNVWYRDTTLTRALEVATEVWRDLAGPLTHRERRSALLDPQESLDELSSLVNLTRPSVREALRLRWLERSTACGVRPVPEPRSVPPLNDGARLSGTAVPVRALDLGEGDVAWSAGGRSAQGSDQGRLHLVEGLSELLPCTLGDFISAVDCDPAVVRAMVKDLASWGGVEVA